MRKINTNGDYEFVPNSICNVGAAVVAGAGIVGGAMSASAAKSAAKTQSKSADAASAAQLQATREANDLQWRMYQQNLANQAPYMQGGQTAYAALMGGMGLGAPRAAGSNAPAGATSATGGSGGIQGVDQYGQPLEGNLQQLGATQADMDAAASRYGGIGGAGQFTETFKPSDLYEDPSYKFRLEQGMQQLKAAGAATGTLQTGQGLKDIVNYSQGKASEEYGNAYNRFMQNQQTAYGRIADLAGIGTSTAGNIGAAGQQTAQGIAGTTQTGVAASNAALMGGANAQAAGITQAGKAWGGGINSAAQNWMQYQQFKGQ